MTLPTLYYLFFKRNPHNEYDVYEAHKCQEKGCIMTADQFVNTCLPGKVQEFVEEYQENLVEGIVENVEVEYIRGD